MNIEFFDCVITDEDIEAARLAIEDVLVARRDARIGVLRNNGLCIQERDGSPSVIVRVSVDEAIRIALDAIAKRHGA